MTTWNLNRLRYTIRKITGCFDQTQLPDSSNGEISISNPSSIDDYINDYYLYDMPEDLRSLRLRNFYTFTTVPNCGTYSIPQNVNQIYDPIYIDNYQFGFYQDPGIFYNIWPELNFIRPIPNDTYAVKMMAYMLPTTVMSAATNAPNRPSIYVDPATTAASAPTSSTVELQGFSGNSNSLPTDLPQFNEFWQLIAYGASLKIFTENGDWPEYENYIQQYEKARLLVQRKTLKQIAQNRIHTAYSQSGTGTSWPVFPLY